MWFQIYIYLPFMILLLITIQFANGPFSIDCIYLNNLILIDRIPTFKFEFECISNRIFAGLVYEWVGVFVNGGGRIKWTKWPDIVLESPDIPCPKYAVTWANP